MSEKTFAEELLAERERLDLNQAACAALFTGLSVGTLRNWETGRNTPPEWAQPLLLDFLRRRKPAKEGSFVKRGRPSTAADD